MVGEASIISTCAQNANAVCMGQGSTSSGVRHGSQQQHRPSLNPTRATEDFMHAPLAAGAVCSPAPLELGQAWGGERLTA